MNSAYTIDAKGRILGRVASEAAAILRGKNTPDFTPHKNPMHKLTILNAKHIKLSGRKQSYKTYKRYSGYPGGLKEISYEKLFEESPKLALLNAIKGMLPRNRMRADLIKNLTIQNDDGDTN